MDALIMIMPSKSKPGYSISGYRNKIRTAKKQVLLVEGIDDKKALLRLLHEARTAGRITATPDEIVVDTAQMLNSPDSATMSNREKVEAVCEGISMPDCYAHFVGFVDREFREFDTIDLADLIGGHRVSGRLVWSRGHSMENYFFDIDIMCGLISGAVFSDSFPKAIELYSHLFIDLLRHGCALSLAGWEQSLQNQLASSIDHNSITVSREAVSLNIVSLRESLLRRTNCNESLTDSVIDSYKSWYARLEVADRNFLRWVCHGHLGASVLWYAYSNCVLEISGDASEARRVLQARDEIRMSLSAEVWSRRAFEDRAEYPKEVLDLLDWKARVD